MENCVHKFSQNDYTALITRFMLFRPYFEKKLDSSYEFGHEKITLAQVFDRFIIGLKITGLVGILNLIPPVLNIAKYGHICNFAKNNNTII